MKFHSIAVAAIFGAPVPAYCIQPMSTSSELSVVESGDTSVESRSEVKKRRLQTASEWGIGFLDGTVELDEDDGSNGGVSAEDESDDQTVDLIMNFGVNNNENNWKVRFYQFGDCDDVATSGTPGSSLFGGILSSYDNTGDPIFVESTSLGAAQGGYQNTLEVNLELRETLVSGSAIFENNDATDDEDVIKFCIRVDNMADASAFSAGFESVSFSLVQVELRVDMTQGFVTEYSMNVPDSADTLSTSTDNEYDVTATVCQVNGAAPSGLITQNDRFTVCLNTPQAGIRVKDVIDFGCQRLEDDNPDGPTVTFYTEDDGDRAAYVDVSVPGTGDDAEISTQAISIFFDTISNLGATTLELECSGTVRLEFHSRRALDEGGAEDGSPVTGRALQASEAEFSAKIRMEDPAASPAAAAVPDALAAAGLALLLGGAAAL